MTPHSVLSLPSDKEVLIISGQKPLIVDKIKPEDKITGLFANSQ
jgi:type IV secretory pathway TraG/TraD family ATPase VirD4